MSSALPRSLGRYLLVEPIGEGGAGEVFLARPHASLSALPAVVVVKTLRAQLSGNPEFVARFKHEAELAVQLDCPSVARVYESGRAGDELYIAMEFVPGWPLQSVLREMRKPGSELSVESGLALFDGLLRSIEELHAARHRETGQALNVVHRDLSPRNVMLQEDGRLRLIDLGIGKSSLQSWKTAVGTTMGSLGYMPPEQLMGQEVDQRADVFALGAVLFELVTQQPYIKQGPVPVMLHRGLNPEQRRASEVRGGVPPALDDIILHALALNPKDRIPNAREFRLALWSKVPRPESSLTFRLATEMRGDDLLAQTQLRNRVELVGSTGATPTPAEVYAAAPEVSRVSADSGPVTEMVWVQAHAKVGEALSVKSTSDPILRRGRSADDALYGTGKSAADALYGDLLSKPDELYPELQRQIAAPPPTKHVGLAAWWFPWMLAPLVASSLWVKMETDLAYAAQDAVETKSAVQPRIVPKAATPTVRAAEPPDVRPMGSEANEATPKNKRKRRTTARRRSRRPVDVEQPKQPEFAPIAPEPVNPLGVEAAPKTAPGASVQVLLRRARTLARNATAPERRQSATKLVSKLIELHREPEGQKKKQALGKIEAELRKLGG